MSSEAADVIKMLGLGLCITAVEIVALCKGKNGLLLRLVIIALAGMAGFSLSQFLSR